MKPSKSEVKRRLKRIGDAACELAVLSDRDLQKMPGSDFLHEEIKNVRRLKAGARKRQIKYLAKIMREEPIDEIFAYLAAEKGSKIKEKNIFHQAEQIRDAIINEAAADRQGRIAAEYDWEPDWHSPAIIQAVKTLPRLDEDAVRKSVYQYVKSRNPVHRRELFRMIHSALEYQQRMD